MIKKEIAYLIILILIIPLFFLSFLIPQRESKKADYLVINLSNIGLNMNYPINYQCNIIKIENNVEISECSAVNKDWICNLIRHTDLITRITENEMECVNCWVSYKDECLLPLKNEKKPIALNIGKLIILGSKN